MSQEKKQTKVLEAYFSELLDDFADEQQAPQDSAPPIQQSIVEDIEQGVEQSIELKPQPLEPSPAPTLPEALPTESPTKPKVDISGLLAQIPDYQGIELAQCFKPALQTSLLPVAAPIATEVKTVQQVMEMMATELSAQLAELEQEAVEVATETQVEAKVENIEVNQEVIDSEQLQGDGGEAGFLYDDPLTKEPFQTLLFTLGGLDLAIPLATLGGIHVIKEDEITPLFGKPSWFMGLYKHELGNINVVNTAKWLMADKFKHDELENLALDYVILLGDSRWGLACSAVKDTIFLDYQAVKWNRNPSKRRWLAGLLIKQMCALLDTNVLANELTKIVNKTNN